MCRACPFSNWNAIMRVAAEFKFILTSLWIYARARAPNCSGIRAHVFGGENPPRWSSRAEEKPRGFRQEKACSRRQTQGFSSSHEMSMTGSLGTICENGWKLSSEALSCLSKVKLHATFPPFVKCQWQCTMKIKHLLISVSSCSWHVPMEERQVDNREPLF